MKIARIIAENVLLILATLGFLTFSATSQTVKGRVLEQHTNKPVPFANIYFDGMGKGVASNDSGYFALPLIPDKLPLIISSVGYYSEIIANYADNSFFNVYLRPKIYELNPVVIANDGISRQEKEKIFKREFLGTSANATSCVIENLDDVSLVFKKKSKTLEAYCDKPILIRNKNLGYKITYFLDKFNYSTEQSAYQGYYYFEDLPNLKAKDTRQIKRRRESTYYGSRMHFIRSLYNDNLKRNGFTVLQNNQQQNVDSLIVSQGTNKMLRMKDRLHVIYDNEKQYTSFLNKQKDFSTITSNGFYQSDGITWGGYMSKERVGDLLPFEYKPPGW